MRGSLGLHQLYYANPVPDTTNQENALNGVMKRIATKMPEIDLVLHAEFRSFASKFIRTHLKSCKITPDENITFEQWIETTPYSGARKTELTLVNNKRNDLKDFDYYLKCFVKDESYPTYKYPRGIYSRADRFKTKFGPIMKNIGDKLFALPYFIKKIPVSDRPEFIKNLYADPLLNISTNDFTAFESTFVALNMEIELDFFDFCLEDICESQDYMKDLRKIKKGKNRLIFNQFVAELKAKRYSGEMDTSLSNSLFNLLLIMFILYKSGEDITTLTPLIEGDDSIIPHYGTLDESIALRCGANAKFEHFDEISHASFCGLVFDVDCLDIVTNIVPAILDFGWSTREYIFAKQNTKLMLLRCKALSMLHSFPGCPVLHSLASLAIRLTNHVTMNSKRGRRLIQRISSDSLRRQDKQKVLDTLMESECTRNHKLTRMMERPINMKTRLLVEKLYQITLQQQYDMEKYLNSITSIQPLDIPHMDMFINKDQLTYYQEYCEVIYNRNKSRQSKMRPPDESI